MQFAITYVGPKRLLRSITTPKGGLRLTERDNLLCLAFWTHQEVMQELILLARASRTSSAQDPKDRNKTESLPGFFLRLSVILHHQIIGHREHVWHLVGAHFDHGVIHLVVHHTF